jgi:hypothetical protein
VNEKPWRNVIQRKDRVNVLLVAGRERRYVDAQMPKIRFSDQNTRRQLFALLGAKMIGALSTTSGTFDLEVCFSCSPSFSCHDML